MPKPQNAESFADLAFPARGIDTSHGFEGQLPGTTPSGVNVRAYEALTERSKGGSRPGISQYVPSALPGVIQHLNIIVDPTTEALLDQFYGMGGGFGGIDGDGTSGAGQGGIPFNFPDLAGGGSAGNGFSGPPWPYPPPPAGWVYDTSTQGPPSSWGALDGVHSRNPGRLIPVGGSGVQTSKNTVPLRVPTIVWSDPLAILTGTALSARQLNATARDPITAAPVAGTFTYDPPSGTVLPAGNGQALVVAFRPLDRRTYTRAAKIVHIDVGTAVSYGVVLAWSDSSGSSWSWSLRVNGTQIDSGFFTDPFLAAGHDLSGDGAFSAVRPGDAAVTYTPVAFDLGLITRGSNVLTLVTSIGGSSGALILRKFTNPGSGWAFDSLVGTGAGVWSTTLTDNINFTV